MKKLTTLVAATCILVAASAFSPYKSDVNEKITTNFEKAFAGASHVNWTRTDDYYLANFVLGEKSMVVAYSEDGVVMGKARQVNAADVPLDVLKTVAANYQGYKMDPQAIELRAEGETNYFITLESKEHRLRLKVAADGSRIGLDDRSKKRKLKGSVY